MKSNDNFIRTQCFLPLITIVNLRRKSVDEILWCNHSNKTSLVDCLHRTSYFLGFYHQKYSISEFLLASVSKRG